MLARDFSTLSDLVAAHAVDRGDHVAIVDGDARIGYAAFDAAVSCGAAALRRDGVRPGDRVAILAGMSARYVEMFLAILRAGGVAVPLPPGATVDQLATMLADSGAALLFADAAQASRIGDATDVRIVPLEALDPWMAGAVRIAATPVAPGDGFNIIYSSGTTGTPKGIVQSHAMRWAHIQRGRLAGYADDAVTLLSTPLYSNTTLVSMIPALAFGGTLVLMRKFDAGGFLDLAMRHRVTHAMLVPVQYARIMAHPDFDAYDLSRFRMKTCTSAPFSAALKADILARWPGGLVEIYGMTEGGATATLAAHLHPDKLETVGRPVEGHIMRLIDDDGREVGVGEAGEIVGRSVAMMTAYHNQPRLTADATWVDDAGHRYIRTGDIGRFDADGFLTLLDRKKDVIISGGFNIYPSDIEIVLRADPDVADAAVVGVPSAAWGETPVAFLVPRRAGVAPGAVMARVNARLGKNQRLADAVVVDTLPRSEIGKVLKRTLRDTYVGMR
nr:class I adenylate-forming enzyme family protein [Hephaestia sp. MAHUQ-44]